MSGRLVQTSTRSAGAAPARGGVRMVHGGGTSHWQRVSRLVAALERTRPMSDPELRRQCLEMAGDHLNVNLLATVRTGPVSRSALYDLVKVLEELPGGLLVLAETIGFLAEGARSSEAFHRLVLELPAQPVLGVGQLRDIHALLRALPDRLPIARVHHEARGTFEGLPPGREDPVAAFDHLAEANARTDGLFPFMVYVEHLALLVPGGAGDRMRAWDDDAAAAVGATAALGELRAGLVPVAVGPGEDPAYLAIQVEWIGGDPGLFAVSSWTKEDAAAPPLPGHHELLCSARELEGTVEAVITDGEACLAALDAQIQVEFILARDLIGWLPVNEWATHRDSGLPRPIVRHYPVVLRSLERQREPALQRVWNRRWRTMSEKPTECRWQVCGGADGFGPAALQDALNRDTGGHVVAVLLLDAPGPPETGVPHVYDVALREGVPAMLWHRSGNGAGPPHDAVSPGAEVPAALMAADAPLAADDAPAALAATDSAHVFRDLLDTPEFVGLPGRVHATRGAAPFGDGMALLHDDPGNLYARYARRRPYGLRRVQGEETAG